MRVFIVLICTVIVGCGTARRGSEPAITVAAAANLTEVFAEAGKTFTSQTGVQVVYSYGATAQLAQQIENGAPFDVFAAADTEHVDRLVSDGRLLPDSRALYARGQLALWIPKGDLLGVRQLADLALSQVRYVAIATPSAAPYGKAAIEALQASGLWQRVEQKVVYASNISMAKQFAATGNADAAFTAYSLVLHESGTVIRVDENLHSRLDQALGVLASSKHLASAKRFASFLTSGAGREILERYGYNLQ